MPSGKGRQKVSCIGAQVKDCRRTLAVFSVIRKSGDESLASDPMESITKEVRMNRQQQARQKARLPTQTAAQRPGQLMSSDRRARDNAGDGR
ncbi:hypothetical protein [Anaerospora sp.]|uniref:hypothetical protein n=1 Tax=Anaerospora sp. TaxID=1960278 RepID=UPI00289B7FCF|nr:hypothetical protein [Anaerospora sp.]